MFEYQLIIMKASCFYYRHNTREEILCYMFDDQLEELEQEAMQDKEWCSDGYYKDGYSARAINGYVVIVTYSEVMEYGLECL